MSIFDERILRPSANIYYFQVVPSRLKINRQSPRKGGPISAYFVQGIIFSLYQGEQQCDQSKRTMPLYVSADEIEVSKVYLNSCLTNYKKDSDFLLRVEAYSKSDCTSPRPAEEPQDQSKKLHALQLNLDDFIQRMQNENVMSHSCCQPLDSGIQISYELYIGRTRFGLEQYIRKSRAQAEHRNHTGRADPPKMAQFLVARPRILSPKSENCSGSSICQNEVIIPGENRFISPTRRIMREKKLLVRNKSNKKGNNTITEEGRSARDSVSLDKRSRKQENRRQSSDKDFVNENEPSNDQIRQSNFLSPEFMGVDHGRKLSEQITKEVSSVNESPVAQQNQFNLQQIRQRKKTENFQRRPLFVDKTYSIAEKAAKNNFESNLPKKPNQKSPTKAKKQGQLYTIHEKEGQNQARTQKIPGFSLNLTAIVSSKAFLLTFAIMSLLLLLHIMTPSKKI